MKEHSFEWVLNYSFEITFFVKSVFKFTNKFQIRYQGAVILLIKEYEYSITNKWFRNGLIRCMDESPGDQAGHTLDRIMNAKEEARRKWDEERENFERSRRNHEVKMIDMEKSEVIRREKEIREMQEAHFKKKLEEYKIGHKVEEEKLEDELVKEEDKLSEVKASLEKKEWKASKSLKPHVPQLLLHIQKTSILLFQF
ncbi:unnamed protein product [Lepeophtheirus salmonis]|uniref:(salmon louse) hypothetical protein n=1 Tax=Lepeophtheirus salmonis TaxID=72036 RepID=A0A7R8HE02_LEPSM|nr:unnamed protein product [Lepeophtheirus salmonis]CAF3039242.1 unnamed protein product [Lepeophtheirus salmonis]